MRAASWYTTPAMTAAPRVLSGPEERGGGGALLDLPAPDAPADDPRLRATSTVVTKTSRG